jgi:hypothetical protein
VYRVRPKSRDDSQWSPDVGSALPFLEGSLRTMYPIDSKRSERLGSKERYG